MDVENQLMGEGKFEKSHILFLQTETLSRESRVTESAQEIDTKTDDRPNFTKCQHHVLFLLRCILHEFGNFTWKLSHREEFRREHPSPVSDKKGLKDL